MKKFLYVSCFSYSLLASYICHADTPAPTQNPTPAPQGDLLIVEPDYGQTLLPKRGYKLSKPQTPQPTAATVNKTSTTAKPASTTQQAKTAPTGVRKSGKGTVAAKSVKTTPAVKTTTTTVANPTQAAPVVQTTPARIAAQPAQATPTVQTSSTPATAQPTQAAPMQTTPAPVVVQPAQMASAVQTTPAPAATQPAPAIQTTPALAAAQPAPVTQTTPALAAAQPAPVTQTTPAPAAAQAAPAMQTSSAPAAAQTAQAAPTVQATAAPVATQSSQVVSAPSTQNIMVAIPKANIDCFYHLPAPTVSEQELSQWAQNAVVKSFEYSFDKLDDQLQNLKACFTDQGWNGFHEALQQSGNLSTIKSQQLTVSSQLSGQTVVHATKENLWQIIVPIDVFYQNTQEKFTQSLAVTLVVTKKTASELGIVQLIATVKPETSPAT